MSIGTGNVSSNAHALDNLVKHLRGHHGSAVNSILYYGSCLRSNDAFAGIVDLYLIVDSYSAVYASKFPALMNWLLPPNVIYDELAVGNSTLRVKYNVLSTTDLRRGLSGKLTHSYLWGRFSQPIELLWVRDEKARIAIDRCLSQAVTTFLNSVLPSAAAAGTVRDLWEQGLRLTYSAEIRSERPGRARELVDFGLDHYVCASKAAIPSLRYPLSITGDGQLAEYSANVADSSRLASRFVWAFRRMQGKILSIARVLKALFTFEGGIDYVVWKLERHSGQPIDIPDRVRKHPLIYVWPLLWKLYRRGIIH